MQGPAPGPIIQQISLGLLPMFDEVLLFLSAAWPTALSICLVPTSLVVVWRAATARPGTRRRRPKRRGPVVVEPMQQSELPLWRGVRH